MVPSLQEVNDTVKLSEEKDSKHFFYGKVAGFDSAIYCCIKTGFNHTLFLVKSS